MYVRNTKKERKRQKRKNARTKEITKKNSTYEKNDEMKMLRIKIKEIRRKKKSK